MPYKDKDKQRAYDLARQRQARDRWLLDNGPCRSCGSWDRLEVDHKNPEDKTSHRIWNWSPARRTAELEKCQPLCHDCHAAKTAQYNQRPITHGTAGGYDRGCRCSECFGWQKTRMDRYHAAHPRRKSLRP